MFEPLQKFDSTSESKSAGRPPVLDERKRRVVLTLLANGSSRRVAANYVGCSPSTISKTIARDSEFAAAVAAAEQNIEIESLREIRRAAKERGNWRAAAWLLERHNPQDFAVRPHDSFSDEQVVDMLFVATSNFIKSMTDEEFDDMLDRLDEASCETRRSPERLKELKVRETPQLPDAFGPPNVGNLSTHHPKDYSELCDEELTEPFGDEEVPICQRDATLSTGYSSGE